MYILSVIANHAFLCRTENENDLLLLVVRTKKLISIELRRGYRKQVTASLTVQSAFVEYLLSNDAVNYLRF